VTTEEVLERLETLGSPEAVSGMVRFGITPARTFGVSMPELRRLGREVGTDHSLALALWAVDTRETRILASLVGDPDRVTSEEMDAWASDFDYWEICDQCCMNLFWRTAIAYEKCAEWSVAEDEYVRRAAFALVAVLAWKDKAAPDEQVLGLLSLVEEAAGDPRPMVKKALDWALRQVGKRSAACHGPALALARDLAADDDKARAWVGRTAAKELESEKVLSRLGIRG
jgi:3-methyladenine DNA glycosylase AlkD